MGLIITESELKKVVKEVTTKIVTKKRLINTIYKVTHKITGQPIIIFIQKMVVIEKVKMVYHIGKNTK